MMKILAFLLICGLVLCAIVLSVWQFWPGEPIQNCPHGHVCRWEAIDTATGACVKNCDPVTRPSSNLMP